MDKSFKELTREERFELFSLQVRGQLAWAFHHSGVVPTEEDWRILRGPLSPTMRQLGEIAGRTGFNLHLQLHELPKSDAPA